MSQPVNLFNGKANAGGVTFRHAGQSRTEAFNATDALAAVLDRREFVYDRSADAVRLRESRLGLVPRVMAVFQLPDGRCQTVCTVAVLHTALFPDGLFEYQHATGRFVGGSLATGFTEWVETDLNVLVEAVTNRVDHCTALDMVIPATGDRPARFRRAFIGPIDLRGSSAAAARATPRTEGAVFGPSLAMTDSPDAFAAQLDADGVFGIRLYGVRRPDGFTGADCRVNGHDHPAGKAALEGYVRSWPGGDPRAERQYVVVRDAVPLTGSA